MKINLKSKILNFEILYKKKIEKNYLKILKISKLEKYLKNFEFFNFLDEFLKQIKISSEIKILKKKDFFRFLFKIKNFEIFFIDIKGEFLDKMKNAATFIFLKKIFPTIFSAFLDFFELQFFSIEF